MYGIIGGTGLYQMEGLSGSKEKTIETPFGAPSAPITIGKFGSTEVAFLPRHGLHHELLPSEINFRANIWALKFVGVTQIISVSASGSLVLEIKPGDLAVPNQYFDWTRGKRASTFFGEGLVAHIATAEPSCATLTTAIKDAGSALEIPIHTGKTYACVEGPRLGSRAESLFLKGAGCSIVGMTNVPEAFLAREAQMCYCTIAVATDYDCWMEDPNQHVSVDKVLSLYRSNIGRIQKILNQVITGKPPAPVCQCRKALEYAVMTPLEHLSGEKKKLLDFLRG